jgi:hypothetical protein
VPGLLGLAGSVEIVAGGPARVWVGLATYWLAVGVLCARRVVPLALPVTVGVLYASAPKLGYDVSLSAAWILVLAFACLGAGLEAPRSQRAAGLASVLACLAVAVAGLA